MTVDAGDDAPALQGISHVALTARDLDAARDFWCDVMGFEVTTQTPDLVFVVHRPSRTGLGVTRHPGAADGPFDETRTGLDHLAFAVTDAEVLRTWQERFARLGVPHSPVVDSGGGLHLNLRAPDGIALELYVMDDVTAAAFGLDSPQDGVSGSG